VISEDFFFTEAFHWCIYFGFRLLLWQC